MKKLFISILLTAFATLIGYAGPNPVLQNAYTTNNATVADAYVRTISRSITNGLATTNYVNVATNTLIITSNQIANNTISSNKLDAVAYAAFIGGGTSTANPYALTNSETRSVALLSDVTIGGSLNAGDTALRILNGSLVTDSYVTIGVGLGVDETALTIANGDLVVGIGGRYFGNGSGLTDIQGSSIAAGTISTNRMDPTAYVAFIGGGIGGTMTNNTELPGVVVGSGIGTNLSSLVTVAGLTMTASYNDILLGSGANGGSLWLHDPAYGNYGQLYYYQDAFRISTDFHIAGELFLGNGLTSDGNVTLGTNALFIGNGVAITNLNLGEITSSIIFVSTTGNDTTGNGTYEKPYQTLLKAQTVAVAGTTICVGPGQWLESDLGKDDVGWELSRGTVIGNAVDGHAPVFTAADISFVVSGFGQILATNTPVTATGSGLIVLDGAFLNYATDPIQQIQGTWRTP